MQQYKFILHLKGCDKFIVLNVALMLTSAMYARNGTSMFTEFANDRDGWREQDTDQVEEWNHEKEKHINNINNLINKNQCQLNLWGHVLNEFGML